MQTTFYARFGKRAFDTVAAFVGLLILSPVFFIVAIAVRLTSSGSAFFSQERVGRFGKPFRILKFRTMRVTPDASGGLLTSAGDRRITSLGRFLRKTKIDELPQLFNVFCGDMSLVGPRPEVPLYVSCFSEDQRRVFVARPGMTGASIIINEEALLAQAQSKEAFYLSQVLPAKLDVDLAYCEKITFFEDVRLILLTLYNLARHSKAATAPVAALEIQHLAGVRKPFKLT